VLKRRELRLEDMPGLWVIFSLPIHGNVIDFRLQFYEWHYSHCCNRLRTNRRFVLFYSFLRLRCSYSRDLGDMMRARVRTLGVEEHHFVIEKGIDRRFVSKLWIHIGTA
jgi:hypothetical protein